MRRKLYLIHFLIVVSTSLAIKEASANATSDAFGLCAVFDGMGQTSGCEVKSATLNTPPSVDVTIDTNGSEARKICNGVADMMAKQTRSFAGKWKLRIFSPYSGQRPIAVCTLR